MYVLYVVGVRVCRTSEGMYVCLSAGVAQKEEVRRYSELWIITRASRSRRVRLPSLCSSPNM